MILDFLKRDLVVHGPLSIQKLNFLFALFADDFGNPFGVVGVCNHFDNVEEVWVLLENHLVHEVSSQGVRQALVQGDVGPLGLFLINHVVVAYRLHASLCPDHFVRRI